MSLASDLSSQVLTILTQFGRSVTLRHIVAGTYDPTTGTTTGDTSTDYVLTGALVGYKDYEVNGTSVLAGDRRCFLAAKNMTVVPNVGDTVIVGTATYSVINFQTQELSGTVLAYALQVRA